MQGMVRAFLADLDSQQAYSQSTRLAYRNDLRCFVDYLQDTLGRPPLLSDLNANQIAMFLERERQAGHRPSTLLRRRASLRRFLQFLNQSASEWTSEYAKSFDQDAHLIDEAISDASPLPQAHYLTDEQIDTLWCLLEASPRPRSRRDHAILALLLESGLTVGTLIALDLPDLDVRAGKLHICLENGMDLWLPLGSSGAPLQRYLREGRPELNYRSDEPALFISQTGGRMCRQGVWQVLRQWGNRAHLPVTLSPRLARHTAAIRLARAGRPISEIQVLLGHRNPLSTQALLRRLMAAQEEENEKHYG